MKNTSIILLSVLLVFVSCSKEKRFEKSLWKDGGEWALKNFTIETKQDNNESSEIVFGDESKMTFSSNGFVIWRYDYYGDISDVTYSWKYDNFKLYIEYDRKIIEFRISHREKKSMDLDATELTYPTYQGQVYTVKSTYKMSLQKL